MFIPSSEWDPYQGGIESCPCLPHGDPRLDDVKLTNSTRKILGDDVNIDYYGYGCMKHDEVTQTCKDGCAGGGTITPPPIDCDRSWCTRSWCWIDPNNCVLLNKRTRTFPDSNRFYSYA